MYDFSEFNHMTFTDQLNWLKKYFRQLCTNREELEKTLRGMVKLTGSVPRTDVIAKKCSMTDLVSLNGLNRDYNDILMYCIL